MNKKAVLVLLFLYSVTVFSASAQVTREDFSCPPGSEFPLVHNDVRVTAVCGPNGSSATIYGCENFTVDEKGPCYQPPDSLTEKISKSAGELVGQGSGLDSEVKMIAAAGILIAVAVFFYEYFHG